MNIETTKLELMRLLLNTQKESVLERIKEIFREESVQDWWTELSSEEQVEIKESLEDLENGKIVAHNDVMKLFDKWK